MAPTTTGKYPVIKLALEESGDNGPFRRIVFTENDCSKLENLKARAVELKTGQAHVARMQQLEVQLMYKDSDGDACVIMSNTDVLDALSQFGDSGSIKMWCKVSNKRLMKQQEKKHAVSASAATPVVTTSTKTGSGGPSVTAITNKSPSYQGGAPVPFHQLVESIVGVLATALVALQGHLGQSGMLVEPKHAVSLATGVVPKKEEDDDAKPVAKPATKPFSRGVPFSDFHMSAPCAAAPTTATPNEDDSKPKATEMPKAAVSPKEAVPKATVAAVPVADQQPEEVESRPFIHGRHTCDVCLTTPIIGGRFHATNLPDYDLCQACHGNYKGKGITFEQVQLDRDMPFQDRWHRRYNKWGTTGRPHFRKHGPSGPRRSRRFARGGPPFGGHHCGPIPPSDPAPPAPSAPPAPQETAMPEEVDAALKEAIRRSMADLKATTAPKPMEAAAAVPKTTMKPMTRLSVKSVEQSVEEVADKVARKMDQVAAKVAKSTKKVAEHVASEEFAESLDEVVARVSESVKMVAEKVDEAVKQHQEAVSKKQKEATKPAAVVSPVEKVVSDEPKLKEVLVETNVKPEPAPVEVNAEDAKPEAVVEDAKPAAIEATEEEIVVPPSGSTVSEATAATTSFELDAAGNGQVAADLGATMDQIVTAIRAMENELDRSSDSKEDEKADDVSDSASFVDAQDDVEDIEAAVATEEEEETATETNGATILSGEETHKDDDSHNSWMVVNDHITSDEALAHAAQVIGSALFNSDMSRSASENISAMSHSQGSHSNASSESSESSSESSASQVSSVDSVPTTLPSITSGGAAAATAPVGVPQVLLDRWTIQLSQLHELGFFDDAVSVETLERLQAANVGSREEEEVTVTQVINELMREW